MMVGNKKFLILILLFVGMISFSDADTSCNTARDRILRISSTSNAHGEVYNGAGNYNEEICFSQLFGQDTPTNPRDCDPNGLNHIVSLSDATNAHARTGGSNAYLTDVCYKDLRCISRNNNCNEGETEILSLSSFTNAHLEIASGVNYDYLICCIYADDDVPDCDEDDICDPGENNNNCPSDCPPLPTYCGDENVQQPNGEGTGGPNGDGNEECDDGNNDATDTCDTEGNTGHGTCSYTFCGDGVVQNNPNNGAEQIVEECDLGDPEQGGQNGVPGSGCSVDCRAIDSNLVASWRNLNDQIISVSGIGQRVKLHLNKGAIDTSSLFKVWERDGGLGGDDSIKNISIDPSSNVTETIGYWDILLSDLEPTDDYDEFYFDIDSKTSNDMEIFIDGSGDDPPEGEFYGPIICGSYFGGLNEVEDIKFHLSDSDDELTVTLTVDGIPVMIVEDPVGSGDYTTTQPYAFSEAGTIKIRVYSIDDDGDEFSMISNVMVIDTSIVGDYVAACITRPENYEYIYTDYAMFDATASKGKRSDGSGSVGDILPGNMRYDWTFSDGRNHLNQTGSDGISNYFNKYFNSYGVNSADLKITTN